MQAPILYSESGEIVRGTEALGLLAPTANGWQTSIVFGGLTYFLDGARSEREGRPVYQNVTPIGVLRKRQEDLVALQRTDLSEPDRRDVVEEVDRTEEMIRAEIARKQADT